MTITVPSIPTPVPTSTDPTNFDERADALLAALPAVVTAQNSQNVENNLLNASTNSAATASAESAAAALSSKNAAATSASEASTSAAAALSSKNAASTSANTASTKADEAAASAASIAAGPVASIAGLTGAVSTSQFQAATGISGFGFKNRIINGDMRIDQRNAGASVTPINGQYNVDRWNCLLSQASKFSVQQNLNGVTPPTGFTNYLGVISLAATTLGSSDRFVLQQSVEGYNIADLGWGTASAKSVVMSFWVRSSLTGTFGGVLIGATGPASYPFAYTISAANTWEYISLAIPGPTFDTWNTTTANGLAIRLSLGCGSTQLGTAGAWVTANVSSVTGATSVVGTSGATFFLTGVQLEKGSTATAFDYLEYGRSLIQCQRYFEFDTFKFIVNSNGSSLLIGRLLYRTTKRAAATVAFNSSNISGGYAPPTETNASSVNGIDVGKSGVEINFGWTASAEL